jgi:hypothetical protein
MDIRQLKEFVCLENRKKELDAELKATKQKLDDIELLLIPQFIEDGVQNMTVDGRAVFLAQDIEASPLDDRDHVIAALKSSDLGQYVAENYNTQSLRAFVREVAADVRQCCQRQDRLFSEEEVRAALPSPLCHALKISFVHSLRSRKV